ncbi:MAG: hypothetical protein KKB50_07110 [Planctomycetes bacterium]|nr:hypothetical protein [Planctomycetota bacterium]
MFALALRRQSEDNRERDAGAWIPKNPRLAELARQIQNLRGGGYVRAARCPSGLPALDRILGGGFPVASLHELLASGGSAAVWTVALMTATRAAGRHRWILYLDTAGDFYPPGVAQLGVPLGRLLVIRTRRQSEALWVCEQALRCRAVAAVVAPLRRLDTRVSRRLQLAAENGGGLALVIRTEASHGHTFAATRLRFEPLVGATELRRMLVTVLKLREGRPAEPFVLELPDAAGPLSAHAPSGHRAGSARRRVTAG